MENRPNYPYNDYNSLKDPNQPGQTSNKQGKKKNHVKNYKKNNPSDEMNINNNDQYHSYHRYPPRNYQGMNSGGNNPPFMKNKKKKIRDNEFQYQGNNAVEVNQQMKDDYKEQNNNMNIGGNNHQNLNWKNYKKNQNNLIIPVLLILVI